MKKFFLFLILFQFSCSFSKVSNEIVQNKNQDCFISSEEMKTWALKENNQYLKNSSYEVIYDNKNIQPLMVIYKLKFSEDTHILKRDVDFQSEFKPDLRVLKSARAEDYKKSGWDKGHLAPSKDFCDDEDAVKSTYLFSNISPQNPFFNRIGAWKKLEEKARKISKKSDEPIQVIAGPIISKKIHLKNLEHTPTIPEYFFKTIIKKNEDGCTYTTFVLKNSSESKNFCKDRISNDLIPTDLKTHLLTSQANELDICD